MTAPSLLLKAFANHVKAALADRNQEAILAAIRQRAAT
jgi:hypothetical protein